MGPLAAAAIAGSAQLLGTGVNAMSQGKLNKKTMQWNEKMFEKQNQRDIEFWNMQNSYNDPAAQMKRLDSAGLNPHLVYGNGADATAGPIATHSAPSWSPKAPDFSGIGDVGISTLSAIYDIKQKKANIAQTEAQTRAITINVENRSFLNQLNTPEYLEAMKKFNTEGTYTRLSDMSAGVDLKNQERMLKEQDFDLKKVLNPVIIDKYKADLRNARSLGDLRQFEKQMKSLELDLQKKGIYKGDELWQRVVGRILTDVLGIDTLGK